MYNIAKEILDLKPYEPGKPIKEVEREYGVTNPIKLASNENVWGPSPKVLEILKKNLNDIFLYPDGNAYYLNKALAEYNNVKFENIISGAGSNEIIEMLLRVFVQAGKNVVSPLYGFSIYTIVSKALGGILKYPKNVKEKHNLFPSADTIISECDENTSVVIIDNPGNPTGLYLNETEMTKILDFTKKNKIILISDEAYLEYVRAKDFVSMRKYFNEANNLIIINTFSKAYALAGLRVGYAILPSDLAAIVNKIRKAFNVNILAQNAAIAALKDSSHMKQTIKYTHEAIDYLKDELAKLNIEFYDTQTNFILIKINEDSNEFFVKLLKKGVIVRPLKPYKLDKYIRISVGTIEQNKILINALKEVLYE